MAAKIKVNSLAFGTLPFRKLRAFNIEFAPRITLIAGHNGIGKSTILGLVANTFGITDRSDHKSYFGEPFYASIERIVYLALTEVEHAQQDPAAAPIVTATVDGTVVRKRCSMTHRSIWKRARVVPRTIDKAEGDEVGQDAKIPLPTIYLGMKRLASAGEADEKEVASKTLAMHADDSTLMVDFVRSVISGIEVNTNVTYQTIRGSRKRTAQPGYVAHDAFAVSVGQDSLGSVATALASFNQLKRDMGDKYPGGLLVIDELDVGFHPHAIGRLVKHLKTYAKRLDLQIIATTHSPRLIEAIHPDSGGDPKAPDNVVYLLDTRFPRLAPDQSLLALLRDMDLAADPQQAPKKTKPKLAVYFEDEQAAQFCAALIPPAKKRALGKKYGVNIHWVPLGLGGSQLLQLPKKDPIFKDRILIVDADTTIPVATAKWGNIVRLPTVKGTTGVSRSPENIIKTFLRDISNASHGPKFHALMALETTNPSSDKVHSTFFEDGTGESTGRESSKAWWKAKWAFLSRWRVIECWSDVYEAEVGKFAADFEHAVAHIASHIIKKS